MLSPVDALSIVLIILTPLTYIPQYHRMLTQRSSAGISVSATILTTLVAQSQVANMYILFAARPCTNSNLPIATPPSTQNHLTAIQIVMQWVCAMIQFALVIIFPDTTPEASPPSTSDALPQHRNGESRLLGLMGVAVHLFLLLLVVVSSFDHVCDPFFGVMNTIRGFNDFIVIPLFTILTIVACICQASLASRSETLGALSRSTVASQAVLFLALAALWPFRIFAWESVDESQGLLELLVWNWYPLVGWICVNSALFGLGQIGVLLAAKRRNQIEPDGDGETQPLLAS